MNPVACWEGGRRRKAALFAATSLLLGLLPHWLHGGPWPAVVVAVLLGRHIFPTAGRPPESDSSPAQALPLSTTSSPIDVLVAAKNEAAVIEQLVNNLLALRYGEEQPQLWIVDDGSVDGTGEILDHLQEQHSSLHVIHRSPEARGWKSGALNAVLPHLKGEWLLVLDADAQVDPELLERLNPLLKDSSRALQLRKAVHNADCNLLTRVQAVEMAVDALIQQGRIAHQGCGELRGNGQFIPRQALLRCGGFNEATITDDLDLTMRLQLHGVPVAVVWNPPVAEEAVSSIGALWRQHQRWAEGGLQRFFDYWPALLGSRLKPRLKRDVLAFFLLQYVQPLVMAGDVVGAVVWRSPPLAWPLTTMTLLFTVTAMARCPRANSGPPVPAIRGFTVLMTLVYVLHWSLIIPLATLRMALKPKHRVWDKTLHGSVTAGA
ncbi:MAG: glycosyltransferase family 2 protein [Synechococcus sp. SB0668_bin_15]|nr:glycosyltransferase family 2 protein [Synechococcus sp. SB0668_bin_15]MXZ82805.1 glycosyltransferase family 2 protein [Synechococcus sp. SB0666_bin_14]MYC50392.1 glycosyltransferase family 2 protein [Synechococcus sp. SB0662_bin_14]MYG47604.1 glycosyltransferase family 2 protein [Synechococcus sp. SB0675_bin_6]MYJ59158.1 glycosyltransferase family 2 protein [Synechococcus sp. SB0672_bin_6]MYK90974.1 glycosyltransferase family 2 protein [Synechococcus sp. SB0669_bin_8]